MMAIVAAGEYKEGINPRFPLDSWISMLYKSYSSRLPMVFI